MSHFKYIKTKKWYIVDLKDLGNPLLYTNEFHTQDQAIEVIADWLKWDIKNYQPILGSNARKHGLKFKQWGKEEKPQIPVTKYDYPPERDTQQRRKTFRTIYRRRLRGELKDNTFNF